MNVARRLSGADNRIRALYDDWGLARQAPERGSGSCKGEKKPKGSGVDLVEMHFARIRRRDSINSGNLMGEKN